MDKFEICENMLPLKQQPRGCADTREDKEQGQISRIFSIRAKIVAQRHVSEKMSLALRLIQKVSLHYQTRLSHVSFGTPCLMMIFDVQPVRFTPQKYLRIVKETASG